MSLLPIMYASPTSELDKFTRLSGMSYAPFMTIEPGFIPPTKVPAGSFKVSPSELITALPTYTELFVANSSFT